MRNTTKLAIAVLLMAGTCFPQAEGGKEEPKFFRLDFVVKELESGKVTNSRSYTMTISTRPQSSAQIRTGNRVPMPSGGTGSSWTYIDVGVNIDCNLAREIQNQLFLHVSADISGAVSEGSANAPPMVRQNKWSSDVIVPIRKPTTIFSSDDPASKRQTQLELTATPIK